MIGNGKCFGNFGYSTNLLGISSRYVLVLLLILSLLCLPYCEAEVEPRSTRRHWCFGARHKFKIIPGSSFGTLPLDLQQEYMNKYDCDEFFCKPHVLRGKGVYKCEPLVAEMDSTG